MKKRLFLVPLLGGFLLSSCSFSDLMFWQKKESSQEEQKHEYKPDPKPPEDTTDHSPVLKEEFGDYKLAKTVEEGKDYVFGVFRHELQKMRFFSGDYHRDSAGYYPYYLGTLAEDVTEGAAKIRIKFKEGSTTEFSMQVFTDDDTLPWNEKYIGIYSAKAKSRDVISIALLDTPDQEDYYSPNAPTVKTNKTNGYWKFHTTLEERNVFAPAADYRHTELGDSTAVPKFLGTAGDFTSMDCQTYQTAIDGVEYDLAHLYEHK